MNRFCQLLARGGLILTLVICATGCASARHQPETVEYKGPIEEPRKKSAFWSVLGFIVTPIANFLSSKDDQ